MKQLAFLAGHRFRRHVLHMWESRGGGFYGLVAVLMFLYLETLDLAGDLPEMATATMSLGWLIGFMVGNLVDLAMNLVWAAIWPLAWVMNVGIGITSIAVLGAAYVAYRAIRPRVVQLLREPGSPSRVDDDVRVDVLDTGRVLEEPRPYPLDEVLESGSGGA